MDNEWGSCDICKKPFSSNTDYIRVAVVRNYTSQGYPDCFDLGKINVHIECLPCSSELLGLISITQTVRRS